MPRHADFRGIFPRRCAGQDDGQERKGHTAQPQDRIRVPELQSSGEDHGGRECGAAADVQPGIFKEGEVRPLRGGAEGRGPGRQAGTQEQPDVRWTDAESGDRQGAGQRSRRDPRRRGDRQPGHPHQFRGAGLVPEAAFRRPHDNIRDPQSRDCELQHQNHHPEGRTRHERRAERAYS